MKTSDYGTWFTIHYHYDSYRYCWSIRTNTNEMCFRDFNSLVQLMVKTKQKEIRTTVSLKTNGYCIDTFRVRYMPYSGKMIIFNLVDVIYKTIENDHKDAKELLFKAMPKVRRNYEKKKIIPTTTQINFKKLRLKNEA